EELNTTILLFSGFGPQLPRRITVLLCYAGDDEAKAGAAIKPFLQLGAVQTQDIQRKPYYAMLEDATPPPPTLKLVGHNGFLNTFSPEALGILAANYGRAGLPIAQIRGLGGAMARVSPQATAFAHRDAAALVVVPAFAPANASEEQAEHIRQAAWRPMEPLSG